MQTKHMERTVIFIKPESIQRHLIGEFISKFERRGLKMIACKLTAPTKEQVSKHYPDDPEWLAATGSKTIENYKAKGIELDKTPEEVAQGIRQKLMDHFTDRPVLMMIWEGTHAIALGRKTAGSTNCLTADIGSIRGDYSMESYELADDIDRAAHTLVHASDSVESAQKEIKLWFKPEEIYDYDLVTETVFYEKNWGKIKK